MLVRPNKAVLLNLTHLFNLQHCRKYSQTGYILLREAKTDDIIRYRGRNNG